MKLSRSEIFKHCISIGFWFAFAILFVPFYRELLLAGIFALAMEPFLGRWLQNRHARWRLSVALILIAMFVVLAVPVTAVAYKAYAYVLEISRTGIQNTPLFQKAGIFRSATVKFADRMLSRVGMADQIDLNGLGEESFSRVANVVMQFLTQTFSQVPELLLSIFVFCAALYFFLAEAGPLKQIFMRQKVLNRKEAGAFITLLQKSSYNTVVTSMIIGVLQATMVSIGAIILNTGDILVVWVVTFFSSFVPVLGAGPVALSLGLGCLVLGDFGRAIGFVVVAAVTATVDNLVRPYLLSSGGDDLHPIVSLLAVIGGVLLFGMSGLFLGPVIASVAVKIIPVLYGGTEKLSETTAAGKDPG